MTRGSNRPSGDARPDSGLHDLSEDATGFGRQELRTIRDAFVRPAAMLEAYMTLGPTGGGEYARPLRFYLTLCGVLMLQLFLMGGTEVMMVGFPPDLLNALVDQSGKSHDRFMADADNWMSLVLVPINALFYALFAAPLIRWWDPEDLGWRRAFRATFHYLNVWTLPIVPIGFLAYMQATAGWTTLAMIGVAFVVFLRIGKDRWYQSPAAGVGKAALITLASFLGTFVATVPMMIIGLGGAVFF